MTQKPDEPKTLNQGRRSFLQRRIQTEPLQSKASHAPSAVCASPVRNPASKGETSGELLVKGRILRVKQGYNPNSSSMGSIVFALSATLLGTTVLFGAVAGLISTAFLRMGRKKSQCEEHRESKPPDAGNESPEIPKNGAGS